ncbi:hypothetical protein NJ76_00900, partial [Rhodococcus sp. IITR03]
MCNVNDSAASSRTISSARCRAPASRPFAIGPDYLRDERGLAVGGELERPQVPNLEAELRHRFRRAGEQHRVLVEETGRARLDQARPHQLGEEGRVDPRTGAQIVMLRDLAVVRRSVRRHSPRATAERARPVDRV